MNIKTPLALALLMTAASAMAQPLLAPATPAQGGTGYFGDTKGTSPLNVAGMQSTNVPDDASFNCSTAYNLHIPFAMCTPEQERTRLSYIGICPLGNRACKDYFERIMLPKDAPNPIETIAAKDPGAGSEWADPSCTQIPCRTKSSPGAAEAPRPGDPNFIGPVLPPADYKEQDKKALEEARKEIGKDGVKDVVDLGNGKIAMMRDDGTVGMCDRGQCEKPVPASEVKNPKVEAWVVENKGYAGVNQNPTGFGIKSNPGSKGAATPPAAPPADANTPITEGNPGDNSAYNSGVQVGRDIASLSGGNGPASSGGSFGSDSPSSGSGSSASTNPTKPIAVSQAEVDAQVAKGYTFNVNIKAANNIPRIAASANEAFADGAKKGRIDVDSTMDVKNHRGGIQASANSEEP